MLPVSIPGFGEFSLKYLLADYNGTLAEDGVLIAQAAPLVRALAEQLEIHVVTADTFGAARSQLADLPVTLTILQPTDQAQAKLDYLKKLGPAHTVAVGNGRNDQKMLSAAAIGIALLQKEGVSAQTLAAADILSRNIVEALELLTHPDRLKATLRS